MVFPQIRGHTGSPISHFTSIGETRGQVSHFPFHFSFSFSYFFTTRLTVELDFCKVGDLTPRPIGIVTDIDTVQDLARAEALPAAR